MGAHSQTVNMSVVCVVYSCLNICVPYGMALETGRQRTEVLSIYLCGEKCQCADLAAKYVDYCDELKTRSTRNVSG